MGGEMADQMKADASPEKRLFISLLTRDIPLIAAFLDLIDNSINAAVEPMASRLMNAAEYQAVFADDTIQPTTHISIVASEDEVSIVDDASGISAATAIEHVFRFGRS